MPILDRRDHNRLIPITFNGQESFQDTPIPEYVSLSMVSNGEYEFLLNGKKYKKIAPFFLCLSENDCLELLQVENYASAQTFSFSPLFLNSSLTEEALSENAFSEIEDTHDRNLINMFRNHDDAFQGIVEIDNHSFLQIREWFSIIGGETSMQSDWMWTCRIRRYLLQILFLLEEVYVDKLRNPGKEKGIAQKAMEYIHTNYNKCIGMQDICDYIGTNRTTLNQKFKEEFSCTAIQYLSRYRIRMAQTALLHTNLTIEEIATCCGYQYESYFVKAYQKNTGESPTEYRRRNW